ncbi:uncharacterized protein LOC131891303 [Tigriopus californicus]|uniref:uncharacterized protein LOC131891303 n=1 Tax=Tigriopus californicus TaxID=6832 RepID=UPI0027DA73BA|nr:uncharacterized protein LOC131891303 [Tigriopus californicus]
MKWPSICGPFVARLRNLSTSTVCDILFLWFCDVGFPRYLKSDKGPQLRGEFEDFCRKHNIRFETSSPYNSQSNGLAEVVVKSMKTLLKKVDQNEKEFRAALLAWRSNPRSDGFSPANGFFGRDLRGQLPDCREQSPPVSPEFAAARLRSLERFLNRDQGHDLEALPVGACVLVQDCISGDWRPGGVILERLDNGRSYRVHTPCGEYRRNRRFLRLDHSVPPPDPDDTLIEKPPLSPRRSGRTRRNVSFLGINHIS